jgi:uncharacterized protein YraI
MRSCFMLLALASFTATAQAQGVGATVSVATPLVDQTSMRGTRMLEPGTRITVDGCLHNGGSFYYIAEALPGGERGLVAPTHVHPDRSLRLRSQAAGGGTSVSPNTRFTAVDVELRSGPSTSHEVRALLPRGRALEVARCEEGWCAVLPDRYPPSGHAQPLGYVAERDLRLDPPAPPRPTLTHASVTLYQKETDGRCFFVTASGRRQYVDPIRCR